MPEAKALFLYRSKTATDTVMQRPHMSEFLQLVAKLDGAGAELDGPTADLDGCATAGRGSVLPGSVLPWEYTRGGGSCFTHGVGATRVRRCCSAGAWTEPSHEIIGQPARP